MARCWVLRERELLRWPKTPSVPGPVGRGAGGVVAVRTDSVAASTGFFGVWL